MSRRGHTRYHEPTPADLLDLDDYKIRTALNVLFWGTRKDIDRSFLVSIGYADQSYVNQMTDKEVKSTDLKGWAHGILHKALSALVANAKRQPLTDPPQSNENTQLQS